MSPPKVLSVFVSGDQNIWTAYIITPCASCGLAILVGDKARARFADVEISEQHLADPLAVEVTHASCPQ